MRRAISLQATLPRIATSTAIATSGSGQRGRVRRRVIALTSDATAAALTRGSGRTAVGLPTVTLTTGAGQPGVATVSAGLTGVAIHMAGSPLRTIGTVVAVATATCIAADTTDALRTRGTRTGVRDEPAARTAGTGSTGGTTIAT